MVGEPENPSPASGFRAGSGFRLVRRGYDQQQVDGHLHRIDAEVRLLAADRDAAADQANLLMRELDDARGRVESLRQQVQRLAEPPDSVQGMSERMRSMLRLAEDEVAETRAVAAADVARLRAACERELTEHRIATDRERDSILASARDGADHRIAQAKALQAQAAQDKLTAEQEIRGNRSAADAEIAGLHAESVARRTQVEDDFRIAMDQRRGDALAALTAEREAADRDIVQRHRDADDYARRTTAEADEQAGATVAAARDEAERLVAAARRQVDELTDMRTRLGEQLIQAAGALRTNIEALAPLDGEADGKAPDAVPAVPAQVGPPSTSRDGRAAPRPPVRAEGSRTPRPSPERQAAARART